MFSDGKIACEYRCGGNFVYSLQGVECQLPEEPPRSYPADFCPFVSRPGWNIAYDHSIENNRRTNALCN
jgi:hypothetical protein